MTIKTVTTLEKTLRDNIRDRAKGLEEVSELKDICIKHLPPELLDLEVGSASAYKYQYSSTDSLEISVHLHPVEDLDDALKTQWAGQTIKMLEGLGFRFTEKPRGNSYSPVVFWPGSREQKNPTRTIKVTLGSCPIPLGCKLKEVVTEVPERVTPAHTEIRFEVVCNETKEVL